jgi:hypothetical protein
LSCGQVIVVIINDVADLSFNNGSPVLIQNTYLPNENQGLYRSVNFITKIIGLMSKSFRLMHQIPAVLVVFELPP